MATKKTKETNIVDEVDQLLEEKNYIAKSDVQRARGKEANGPPSAGRLKNGQTQGVKAGRGKERLGSAWHSAAGVARHGAARPGSAGMS